MTLSRDAFFGRGKYLSISASRTLNPREARGYVIVASGTQNAVLPDARTLRPGGPIFFIYCNGGTVTVRDAAGGLGATLTIGKLYEVYLTDNSTLAGVWTGRIRTIGTGSGLFIVAPRIFIPGGAGAAASTLSVYSPIPNTWAAGAVLLNNHVDAACMRVGGRAFLVGFYPQVAGPSQNCEELEARTGAWTSRTGAPFSVGRDCGAGNQRRGIGEVFGCSTTGVLQANPFGGSGGHASGALTSIFLSWSTRRALPIFKARHACSALEGLDRVIVIAGEPVPSPNLAHNLATDTWWTIPNGPSAFRHSQSAFTVNGLVYACGGRSEGPPITRYANVDEYNPFTDSWASVSPLTMGVRYEGAAVSGYQRGYYIGGNGPADTPSNLGISYVRDTWSSITGMNVTRGACANHGAPMA